MSAKEIMVPCPQKGDTWSLYPDSPFDRMVVRVEEVLSGWVKYSLQMDDGTFSKHLTKQKSIPEFTRLYTLDGPMAGMREAEQAQDY